MNKKFLSLAFLFFWVVLGLGVYFREWWMPADVREKIGDEKAHLFVLVAVVFAFWNLARYFVAARLVLPAARSSPEVEEYRRRIRSLSGNDPKVTDPQFNFDDPPPDKPAGPAA